MIILVSSYLYSDIVKDGLFNIRYEQSKKLIKVTAPSVNFLILATAVEESICHFYFPDVSQLSRNITYKKLQHWHLQLWELPYAVLQVQCQK